MRLSIWTNPRNGENRVYLNSGNRRGSKLFFSAEEDGSIAVHSKNLDTTTKYLAGDVYGKRDKDSAAATEVLESLGLTRDSDFDLLFNHANGAAVIPEIFVDEVE